MKINEMIKEKRKELKLTQEKVAEYLGVSTPAVNKWEKGTSYPDITLLPALARLLKTDLNTLLSFNEELTDNEIGYFANELVDVIQKEGFELGYKVAIEKIQEYPNCDKLIYTVALSLEGMLVMLGIEDNKKYYEQIEKMYERIANSEDTAIRNQAISMLISKHMEREEYDQVQELLDILPKHPFDKRQLQANLYIKKGKYHVALELLEKKLIEEANEIQTILLKLMEVHIKENKMEEAEHFANTSQKTAQLYDLWEYNSYMAHFQLALSRKDENQCIKLLKSMFAAMMNKWNINRSPLYMHIKVKEDNISNLEQFLSFFIAGVEKDKELEFLRDNPEYRKLINQYAK